MSFRFQPWLGCRRTVVEPGHFGVEPLRARTPAERSRATAASTKSGYRPSREFHRRAFAVNAASGSGHSAGAVHPVTASCPLVHRPFSSFLFSFKRRKERSSNRGCGLWGQPLFVLVVRRVGLWMNTGCNRWMVPSGGGQLRRPQVHPQPSTVVHTPSTARALVVPIPCGFSPSPPIGVWVDLWVSCDQLPGACGSAVHSLWVDWGELQVRSGDGSTVDSRRRGGFFWRGGEAKDTRGPRKEPVPWKRFRVLGGVTAGPAVVESRVSAVPADAVELF